MRQGHGPTRCFRLIVLRKLFRLATSRKIAASVCGRSNAKSMVLRPSNHVTEVKDAL